jgi:hypothetical protein
MKIILIFWIEKTFRICHWFILSEFLNKFIKFNCVRNWKLLLLYPYFQIINLMKDKCLLNNLFLWWSWYTVWFICLFFNFLNLILRKISSSWYTSRSIEWFSVKCATIDKSEYNNVYKPRDLWCWILKITSSYSSYSGVFQKCLMEQFHKQHFEKSSTYFLLVLRGSWLKLLE